MIFFITPQTVFAIFMGLAHPNQTAMRKDYKASLSALDSFRRVRGTIKGIPPPGKKGSPAGLYQMAENLRLLNYRDADLDRLKAIHIAGTKGKGSTSMFTNCFLQAHGDRTNFPRKIGLYTTPFLVSVRENIRINRNPISEATFTKYFFEVWDKLSNYELKNPGSYRLGYNQVLTLLAFHVFLSESVDVAIFEANSGGTYDATNIVKPNVVGITSLGIDHVSTLGSTIESIAWHKSGIFKHQIPAFSSHQVPAATAVLEVRAAEKFAPLTFVDVDDRLPDYAFNLTVQKKNASLALALSRAFLQESVAGGDCEITSHDITHGLALFSWPGRFQQVINGNNQWFLDSAHNQMSMSVVGNWFAETTLKTRRTVPRILIFSHASERDGQKLVEEIAKSFRGNGLQLQHVVFCKMEESKDLHHDNWFEVSDEMQQSYAATWRSVDSIAQISLKPSVKEALAFAKMIGEQENGMQTLVTGSNYLVGAALHLEERGGLM